jgi:hypothetical protein
MREGTANIISPGFRCRSIRATGGRLFLLKFNPLVGVLEIDMERLAQAV